MRLPFRIAASLAFAGALAPFPQPLGAQAAAARADSVQLVSPAPSNIARLLVADSAGAHASRVPSASSAPSDRDCATRLRDPRSGVGFLLMESRSEQYRSTVRRGVSVLTIRVEGNYVPTAKAGAGTPALVPPDRFLRVACGSNEVLGVARSFHARS